jgi:hypothetical protein
MKNVLYVVNDAQYKVKKFIGKNNIEYMELCERAELCANMGVPIISEVLGKSVLR